MKKYSFVLVLIILFCCSRPSEAFLILDTGYTDDLGINLYSNQWLSTKVSLNDDYNLTGILTRLNDNPSSTGTLTLSIYGDSGTVPNTSQLYFRDDFTVSAGTINPSGGYSDWYGVSNVDLALSQGDYWFAFEIRGPDTYSGEMKQGLINTSDYAFGLNDFWSQAPAGSFQTSLQINGYTPGASCVPEPSTTALLSIGFLGFAFIKRKAKK